MKNKKYFLIFFLVLVILSFFLFKNRIPTVNIPTEVKQVENKKGEFLEGFTVPEGFQLSIFAEDLPGARTIFPVWGGFLISQTKEGKITFIADKDGDGFAEVGKTILDNLNKPHGIEILCEGGGSCNIYIAEQDKLSVYEYDKENITVKNGKKILDLPHSLTDRHFTRSLLVLPPEYGIEYSDTLLISIGSSCDVCYEKNPEFGSIISYNVVTNKKEIYATGLRNAVFMTLDPIFGKVFATEMGRDNLGDDLPPDEINIIEKGKNYGWPVCYGKNVHDTQFDKNTYIRNPCTEPFETPSFIDLQAHSAPLGLAFIGEEGWAEEYWYNLLVAYHGSWNRSEPTGYKIARIKMNAKGEYLGTEDFINGWLTKDGKKTGRPVDIKVFPGGTVYISDDMKGVIYKLSRTNE